VSRKNIHKNSERLLNNNDWETKNKIDRIIWRDEEDGFLGSTVQSSAVKKPMNGEP